MQDIRVWAVFSWFRIQSSDKLFRRKKRTKVNESGEFLHQLSYCQLLKKEYLSRNHYLLTKHELYACSYTDNTHSLSFNMEGCVEK
jgi:hypothetical protein